jgi:hypothetical protein
MDAKKFAFIAAIFWASQANAVSPASQDLGAVAKKSPLWAESIVTRADCVNLKSGTCDKFVYKLTRLRLHRGTVSEEYRVETRTKLSVGSRYLHYVLNQGVDGLKNKQDFFAEIVDQPYFDGKDWVNKKFIILPKGVDGERIGAFKSNARTCHIEFRVDGSSVKICDVSGVIEYEIVLRLIAAQTRI